MLRLHAVVLHSGTQAWNGLIDHPESE